MYRTHYVVGLLVLYIGIGQAVQNFTWGNDWQGSNRDFNFDDRDGSADGPDMNYVWRDDEDDSSGWESDDITSGDYGYIGAGTMTECKKRFNLAQDRKSKRLSFEYVPRCTIRGAFEALQCNEQGGCWCVNFNGQEIPDTRRGATRKIDCSGHDRTLTYSTGTLDIDNPFDEGSFDKTDDKGTSNKKPKDDVITIDDNESDKAGDSDDGHDVFKTPSEQTNRPDFLSQPLILAGIIAFAVVCLLCAVLLVMFIVYRMRKKDEGSYALDEPKRSPSHPYQRAPTKEYFA